MQAPSRPENWSMRLSHRDRPGVWAGWNGVESTAAPLCGPRSRLSLLGIYGAQARHAAAQQHPKVGRQSTWAVGASALRPCQPWPPCKTLVWIECPFQDPP